MTASRTSSSATSPERPTYVAVVGAGDAGDDLLTVAEEVGRELGRAGAVVVTGGLGGVMEAAARGASSEGGMTVALLPGGDRNEANPYSRIAITTELGEARNVLVVRAADAVIAVGGGFGTLSEIAFALKTGTPVVALSSWDLGDAAVTTAGSAADAVRTALEQAGPRAS